MFLFVTHTPDPEFFVQFHGLFRSLPGVHLCKENTHRPNTAVTSRMALEACGMKEEYVGKREKSEELLYRK